MSKSLREVQKIVKEHLLRELDIMEMVLKLDDKDAKVFLVQNTNSENIKGFIRGPEGGSRTPL